MQVGNTFRGLNSQINEESSAREESKLEEDPPELLTGRQNRHNSGLLEVIQTGTQ